nr:uncharacterized protein LOC112287558 isoform X2 [Physcomitrium patens]|eukprot:XP_024386416.1 uncharacterized protein LOC112287558 isoform X2 [Physcomitrella patens]
MRKKVKKCEGAHIGLVHIVEDVRSTTSELAKAVGSWLPRYKAAARVVNDLFCKVERAEEKFQRFSCDEGLARRISHIAESKIEGLKEHVSSNVVMENIGQDLRDLHERVENSDRIHCQVNSQCNRICHLETSRAQAMLFGEIASRLAVLERTINRVPGQPVPGLSLRVEYMNSAAARRPGLGSLSQSLEALEEKMEIITEHTGALVGGHESANDTRLLGLESRIEHIASATFSNLRPMRMNQHLSSPANVA